MISDIAIRGEGLGKRYRIGQQERYLALRDVLARALKAPWGLFGANGSNSNHRPQHIWALKDVGFEIKQGEIVGLIGRNGAGKTTLLKILARVTKPTTGHAEVRGRVGSLLEVGTGFHPELTGRENVYLSGAILGMKRSEIVAKFDEIVAFADVAKFIDTPLKYYSSGMNTRLAFSVAAHLEPEILLVDEVLSVGDAAFQKKCIGKMGEVTKTGRTVVFVSHQMNQIRRLCERAIWLDGGRVRQTGPTEQVLAAYEEQMASLARADTDSHTSTQGAAFLGWEVVEPRGALSNSVASGQRPVSLKVRLKTSSAIERGLLTALVSDADGRLLSGWAFNNLSLKPGLYDVLLEFSSLPLRPGAYDLFIKIQNHDRIYEAWNLTPPLVIEGAPVTHFMDEWAGVLNIPCSLDCSRVE